jgi:hypothetical protein
MVDRHARDIAADAIRDFMEGSISNKDYERRFPSTRTLDDPALQAVFSHIWFCYDDLSEHTLTGEHALTGERRAFLERSLLFLRSDLEFQWPPPLFGLRYWILRLLGFGRRLQRREDKEMSVGDIEVYPFLTKAEYEETVRRSKTSNVAGPDS